MHGYHSAYALTWQDLLSSEIAGCARSRRTGRTAVLLARAANGTPSRDGADKALGPRVAAAHPLQFHPSGASQYVVEYRHLTIANAIFAVFAHSCQ
jgi:hypothetical protein